MSDLPGPGAWRPEQPTERPGRRPARPPRQRSARFPVVIGVAGLLVAGGIADRAAGQPGPAPVAASQPVPVAAPAAALSSSWFCAGATGTSNGAAAGKLVIANAGDQALRARVRLVASRGAGRSATYTVAAHSTTNVDETLPGDPPWVGAVVDLDGGAAAVDQVVSGPLGQAATPCATAGSQQWYFATGQTLVNATDTITLLNPYPTDAVVDMTFTTEQGVEAPGDFQGLVVPAGGLLSVDLRSHLRRRKQIATTVHARSGRVVAWSTEVVTPPAPGEATIGAPANPANPTSADPAAPAAGVVLTLGSPSAGRRWAWPDGEAGNGLDERYVIYNPSARPATVSLSVALDQGQAEPFRLTVGPQAVTTIVSDSEARIPPGVGHTATLVSTNGVGVVATRTVAAVAPAARRGVASLPGARMAAAAWLVPVAATGGSDSLALLAPGPNPLDVTLFGMAGGQEIPLPGLSGLTLPGSQRTVISLAAKAGSYRGPIVVRATGPIYVESDLGGTGTAPGFSLSTGVPLS
ncbi:hypothetical protein K6U06_15085 [Acidiferrimicrobium sp. IK]|uniref:DUF5719 family protein n=1 Tax=Acidiferrimicrobium sp. IK TaxID=2871700 RepID=UPI0021CAE45E|nr:DUF5719 family protein [Acidiferrimicrobium sp. IK]MCU4185691.1 hypothetical protein [Acidiferrimicrobium sp. IK]